MQRRTIGWVIAAFSVWLAPLAQAGLITLGNSSFIAVGSTQIQPMPSSLYFSESIGGPSGFASESYSLGSMHFGALGGATSTVDPSHAVFDVTFSVDAATLFSLDGFASGNLPGVVTLTTAFLSDSSGAMHVFNVGLDFTGVLTPDKQYRLYVAADPPAGWAANWSFNLTLPVPEPSRAALLGSALAAVALWRARPAALRSGR